MASEQHPTRSSRGSTSDTAPLPCPSPTSSTAGSVSCTLCGTRESLVWLPQADSASAQPHPSDQFVLCTNCTAAQHLAIHNTRQSSSRRQRNSSASNASSSQTPAREKERAVPTSSDAVQSIPEETPADAPKDPAPSQFRMPRKSKPARARVEASTTICDRVFHEGVRFEAGDIVSLIDRDNQGIYFAIVRGLISDIYADKFAFLTWLLPLEPVHVKSLAKPAFQPSKYCMGPQDYVPRKIECLRFECSSPLSPSYRYPKSKIDSPFM